ncbi:MAG: hypothetical protein WCA45_09710 [Thiobacillaceae bacterium]
MEHKKRFNRTLAGIACTLGLAAAGPAQAVNWLMLQGTEDPSASARANVWGFIQAGYQKDYSDPNAAGQFVPPKMLGPDLDSQSGFNINRARIGVRGRVFRSTATSTISSCWRWATTESPREAAPSPE